MRRILLASSDTQELQGIVASLEDPVSSITTSSNTTQAALKALQQKFDLVIIRPESKDETSLQVLINLRIPLIVLGENSSDSPAWVYFFDCEKPLISLTQTVFLALQWKKRLETGKKQEDRLLDTKVVERAKGKLISTRFLTEEQAHRYIEKKAMDLCLPKYQVAQRIMQDCL